MFCGKCGTQLPEGSNFCSSCGNAVAGENNEPVAPVQQPVAGINQDEPENVLLKAMVTAEEQNPPYATNNGTLIITNKRIVYKSSRFLNIDVFGEADSDLSIYYNEITEFKNARYNLVLPAIEITTKNGYKIKFAGYGKIKTAYEIICEKMKLVKYTALHA